MKPSRSEIRNTIIDIVRAILKERGLEEQSLTGETLLSAELGLSSMDALRIISELDLRLRTKLPFDQLIIGPSANFPDLKVNELAAFAEEHFEVRPAGPAAM